MTLRRWRFPSVLAALLVLSGCSEEIREAPETVPEAPGTLIASDKQRVAAPAVPAEDVAALAASNTNFGAALYRQAARPGENLFFSPYSISQALSMVYAGARGTTEAQMAQALRFTLPQDRHHPAMNALDLSLHGRVGHAGGKQGAPEFRAVNATWGQQDYVFEPAFLDVLALHYGAGVRAVDFKGETELLRTQINDWVEGQTNQRIQELLPAGSLRPDTRLVLTNALYFKGGWAEPFEKQLTRSGTFHLQGGGEQQVEMMGNSFEVPRMKGEGFEAAALPYVGGAFRMLIILPASGRFEEIEARLSAEFLDGIRGALRSQHTALSLPRFQVEMTLPLGEALQGLGMVDAFTRQADFSGITLQERLAIHHALHKAFISVDEEGTEAAAATEVTAGPVSMPPAFTVDRPFLFLIEEVETKAVLFLGRVMKP